MDQSFILIVGGLLSGALIGCLAAYLLFQRRVTKTADEIVRTKQNAFIAIASHYLLTPISIIQSSVTRLTEKADLPLAERNKLYENIYVGERRLYLIAEQALLAIKLVRGGLDMFPQVSRLDAPVYDALKEIELIGKHKKITFKTAIEQNPPIEAAIDARLIKTATVALLDNAVKFSPEGGQVKLALSRDRQRVLISVSDGGIGMTAQQLAHATDKFYRGTPPYTFDYEGMGLGLHIAYIIAQAHGGDILIESPGPGRGTVSTIVLPLD